MKDNAYSCVRAAYLYEVQAHSDWSWGDPPCWPKEVRALVTDSLVVITKPEPEPRYRLTAKGVEWGRKLKDNPDWRPYSYDYYGD